MTSPSLEDLRALLRQRDEAIVSLLNKRAQISIQIGHIKRKANSSVYDRARENAVYDYLSRINKGPLPEPLLKNIFGEILSASRLLQSSEVTFKPFDLSPDPHGALRSKESKDTSAGRSVEPSEDSYKKNGMICVPVVALSNEEAFKQLNQCLSLADFVELRIDFIKNVDLKSLLSFHSNRIMVTNRTKDQGGMFTGEDKNRLRIFEEAVSLGAGFIDMESNTDDVFRKSLMEKIHLHKDRSKLIISYHDFTGTPSYKSLKNIFHECLDKRGDIIKIVTLANKMEDNLNIMKILLYAKRMNKKIIAHCMGEIGKISRIMAPFFGSFMTFASLEKGSESAPGQFRINEMSKLLRILEYGK